MTQNRHPSEPLLIYDKDCGFCLYWIYYWQKLTGNAVSYKAYQDVHTEYPSISIKEFQRSIQYIADGKIASGAEASFLTLSHARWKYFWLWLYYYFPGFAFFSEKMYHVISTHRSFFYKISILLWGRVKEPPQYEIVSWVFLRAIGFIYLAAFISFATQALGLIGDQGILPLSSFVDTVSHLLGIKRFWLCPMLFWFNASNIAIQLISWGGAFLSVCLIFNVIPRIALVLLYLFYLSLVYAGQVFMTFQWDLLLLESGILALFLFRFQTLGIWLLRWLLFRFIFVSGLVKWMSGDITWRNFSALSYHFLTQPLPTPLGWYAHHLPESILKCGTIATLVVEIGVAFLLFFPRKIRFFAGFIILIFQSLILITGNYNFFNLLAIVLCISLFDDAAFRKIFPGFFVHFIMRYAENKKPYKLTVGFAATFTALTVFLSIVQFNMKFVGRTPESFVWLNSVVAPFFIVNTYGPFSVMTTERMEIIIEGSDDGVHWKEYAFKYKPGDVMRGPRWNIPHQPRLDWQLWFAALDTAENTPWFLYFIQRLLENSPAVTQLMEYNPFPNSPPIYIRAEYYEYTYTSPEEKEKTGAWWKRRWVMLYLPEVHLSVTH